MPLTRRPFVTFAGKLVSAAGEEKRVTSLDFSSSEKGEYDKQVLKQIDSYSVFCVP